MTATKLSLRPREEEGLVLFCEGLDARAISLKLGIQTDTLRSYMRAARLRNGCATRAQLVARFAVEQS